MPNSQLIHTRAKARTQLASKATTIPNVWPGRWRVVDVAYPKRRGDSDSANLKIQLLILSTNPALTI